jgi:four helix bundle protein
MTEQFQNNPIMRHSFEFALMIDGYCSQLQEMRRFDMARQLFKSGTSIGANTWEAQEPESKSDFVHKMKIAAKEAREASFWLLVCKHGKGYPAPDELITKLAEIRRILSAIIHSAKQPPLRTLLSWLFPF